MAKEPPSKAPKKQEGERNPPGVPLEFLEFSSELMNPGGLRDRRFGARGRWIAEALPPTVAGSFAVERIGELSGQLGDPWVATPVQIDRVAWRGGGREGSVTVYNRAVALFGAQGSERKKVQRVHRFFEAARAASHSGGAPESTAAPSVRRSAVQTVAAPKILRVKVVLAGIRPPVWRRLELPTEMTLAGLHGVLQIAFAWSDDHLHQFECRRERWGVPSTADFEPVRDERRVRVVELLRRAGDRLDYEYDFGDAWRHRIAVEAVVEPEPGVTYPRCTEGRRAAPPEDSGGPFGYPELLALLANPEAEGHGELLAWLGEPFDPEAFDLAAVNRRLVRRGKSRKKTDD